TTVLAVLFMLSCILLTFISKGRTTASSTVSESAVGKSATEQMQQQQMPATTPVGGQPAPAEGEQPPAGTGSEGIFDEESASEGEIPPPPEEGGN
ncbi:MAG: hypothetical protein KAT58_10385, partial [candidate division Zixibacteria bacterium]|nr:hypothetical protein [candidate division Zixibacteria bacterium]